MRPTHYPCSNMHPHTEHVHNDGPDAYYYKCDGVEPCPHPICKYGHGADACGWCGECHPEVPEW